MESGSQRSARVVVIVRIAGNVFAVSRMDGRLQYRRLEAAVRTARIPDQRGAFALLRKGG